jgi:outer membrane protein assembly factor BamB
MNLRFSSLGFALSLFLAQPFQSFAGDAVSDPAKPSVDWQQWRGPKRDSQINSGNPWPNTLDEGHLKRLWRVETGPGYSGPICDKERVYTTATIDRSKEVVAAFERKTGKLVWKSSWDGAMTVPFFAKENGDWIRSTPTLDGDRLYVAGMRDVLVCLEAKTGKEIWRVDFTKRHNTPLPAFGFVCSPLVEGDSVYVQAGAAVVKLDKLTGEEKWRALNDGGGMWGSAFSSPILADFAGKKVLLIQSRTHLAGINPEKGDVLWKKEIPAFRGMNILTPLVVPTGIFTSSYGGKSFLLKEDGSELKEVWTNKAEAYMSSPVVIGGYIYLHLRNQRFACIDIATGDAKWTTTQSFGKYWSMIAQGDKILALDQRGVLRLIKANPEKYELISERKVSDQETWGHLGLSGDTIFIRDLNGLNAWEWSHGKPAAPASE